MDENELKGIYFKSENDNTTHYFIHIAEFKEGFTAKVDICQIDDIFSVLETYEELKTGDELSLQPFEIIVKCKLDLWGKYFYPTFDQEMQLYYDDEKYYAGKYKSDPIQSLADAINFAIEYGLKTADIKPY